MSLTMRDTAGWSIYTDSYIVYAVRAGNVAEMKFGRVLDYDNDSIRIIGTDWMGDVNTRESRLTHSSRVLIINECQVPSKTLPGLRSWPSKVMAV